MPRGFRRRAFGGFRHRGTRPQLIWFRQPGQVTTLTSAVPVGAPLTALFGPTVLESGLDQRLTVRRIRMQLNWFINNAVDPDLMFTVGLAMVGVGEPVRAPDQRAAQDQQTDWMAIATHAAGSTNATDRGDSKAILGNAVDLDVRAMRKVDEDQLIVFSATMSRITGAVLSAGQSLTIRSAGNVLFQRTQR